MFIRCRYHISLHKWLELKEKKLGDLSCERKDYVIEKRARGENDAYYSKFTYFPKVSYFCTPPLLS